MAGPPTTRDKRRLDPWARGSKPGELHDVHPSKRSVAHPEHPPSGSRRAPRALLTMRAVVRRTFAIGPGERTASERDDPAVEKILREKARLWLSLPGVCRKEPVDRPFFTPVSPSSVAQTGEGRRAARRKGLLSRSSGVCGSESPRHENKESSNKSAGGVGKQPTPSSSCEGPFPDPGCV